MASSTTRPTSQEGFAMRKLVWVGPLTIIVAVLINLVIRTLAVAFFGVSDGFTYLQAPFVTGRPGRLVSQPRHGAGRSVPCSGHESAHLLDHDRDAHGDGDNYGEPADPAYRRTGAIAARKEVCDVFRARTGFPASATPCQDCHRGQRGTAYR